MTSAFLRSPAATWQKAQWLQVASHLDPKYGGLSSAVSALAASIAQRERIATPIAAFCAPDEQSVGAGAGLEQVSYWPASRRAWLGGRELRRKFHTQVDRATGLHIHGLWEASTALACSATRRLGIPYVLSSHGMLEPWALANGRVKKLLYKQLVEQRNVAYADCLHALTLAEAEQLCRFGARGPIAIIPNGVDVPFIRDAQPFLNLHPELEGKRIVLYLARLHPKKGVDLLLQAWQQVALQHADAHLVIAGPDSENMLARLQQQASKNSLADRITFTGMLAGTMKWSALAAAEAFILPSHSEGLSVSVLEAMGMGLPVVVTFACNMPEVTSTRSGWEIETAPEAIADALSELFDQHPRENAAIGKRGAQLVRERYTWAVVASKMASVYRWIEGAPMPEDVELVHP